MMRITNSNLGRVILWLALLCWAPKTAAEEPLREVRPETMDVVILGDSLTWLGGDDCTGAKGWSKWFKEAFGPRTCMSYARSGATWSNTEETVLNTEENIGRTGRDNVIYNQVARLATAVDSGRQERPSLILVACGTNDAWFPDQRPEAYAMSADEAFGSLQTYVDAQPGAVRTLAQSVCYNVAKLKTLYPEARLVLITPPQTTAVTLEKIERTGKLIEACGGLMGCDVVRMDKQGVIRRQQELKRKTNTYDGTHTNARGAKGNGEVLAKVIRTMLAER